MAVEFLAAQAGFYAYQAAGLLEKANGIESSSAGQHDF
jgi:hypothetical protein